MGRCFSHHGRFTSCPVPQGSRLSNLCARIVYPDDMSEGPRIPPAAWIGFVLFDIVIAAVVVWWFVFRDG